MKHTDGRYHINGKTYKELIGKRAKVMHGTAYKTDGGLTKSHLKYNKSGKIVSLKKSKSAKKENRLKKHGWGFKKGSFGAVRLAHKSRKGTRKHKSRKHKK